MTDLDVHAHNGSYDAEEVTERFRTYGIVVLKAVLPPETRDDIRAILERRLTEARQTDGILKFPEFPAADFLIGDVLAVRELEKYNYLFFQPELLRILKVLLQTPELLYFGDSSVQFGEAARGFHKDNVDRYDGTRDDWAGDYGLIRCAFYCQDHVNHSGGLKVRLRSHNVPTHRWGQRFDVRSQYGDVVLWSMRLTHSGNTRKLRGLRSFSLHPRLEEYCPSWLTAPEQMRRVSAFCAFGRPGSHTDRYLANMNVREKDYKVYFQRARRAQEAQSLLGRYGVGFRQPNDYYGQLDK